MLAEAVLSHNVRSLLATISPPLDPLFDSNHNNPWLEQQPALTRGSII